MNLVTKSKLQLALGSLVKEWLQHAPRVSAAKPLGEDLLIAKFKLPWGNDTVLIKAIARTRNGCTIVTEGLRHLNLVNVSGRVVYAPISSDLNDGWKKQTAFTVCDDSYQENMELVGDLHRHTLMELISENKLEIADITLEHCDNEIKIGTKGGECTFRTSLDSHMTRGREDYSVHGQVLIQRECLAKTLLNKALYELPDILERLILKPLPGPRLTPKRERIIKLPISNVTQYTLHLEYRRELIYLVLDTSEGLMEFLVPREYLVRQRWVRDLVTHLKHTFLLSRHIDLKEAYRLCKELETLNNDYGSISVDEDNETALVNVHEHLLPYHQKRVFEFTTKIESKPLKF
ncbi:hypothetical protein [Photobacterium phage PDCC-1]|uniref:Uncharacterized protein n=1 Tax=Photobacterium phage PDCC-1 TaxID=2664246 RepID=A0A6B9J4M1_9CAUD|nr:hypothetical protein HWC77_gp199 [Photobacterium phage PDCC-1]QGZ14562.1 hypothetical protein [Photobacterium phage PDCC-1]